MKEFVLTDDFKSLNIAVALDEGLANPTDKFTVFYGERAVWWLKVPPPNSRSALSSSVPSNRSNLQGLPDMEVASSRTLPWRNSSDPSSSFLPSGQSRKHVWKPILGTPFFSQTSLKLTPNHNRSLCADHLFGDLQMSARGSESGEAW